MEDNRFRIPPLAHLGWAFLLAWVFCVFYTTAAGGISSGPAGQSGAPPLCQELFFGVMPLGSSVVMLALIVLAEPKLGAPTHHKALFFAAPLLTAASTPLMFLALADPLANGVLFGLGSVATGVGSALLWVMWGEYYAVIPREESEGLAPLSAVLSAALVLIVSATSGWVPIALATAFPLISGLCLRQAWTSDCTMAERALAASARREGGPASRPLAGLGRTGFGILAVFSIVSIAGQFYDHRAGGQALQGILVFSALMMALVAFMAISGPRRISLAFLYRWMCPVLVVGFCAVILLGATGGIVSLAASIGGRFTFCLIAQVYFASYAASGRATPTQATSLGWLFVHLGDLVGYTTFLLCAPLLELLPDGILWICCICIAVLVTVTMFVLNDTASFHRPLPLEDEGASGDAGCEEPASSPAPPAAETPVQTTETASPTNDDASGTVNALAAAHKLTPRETEVFALLAQGRSIPYIRDELIISRETAATHAKHIYAKLGVHSRQELIDLVQRPAE